MRVAIIGANGFVGRAVSRVLSKKGYYVHGFIRDAGIMNYLSLIKSHTFLVLMRNRIGGCYLLILMWFCI